jgi:hypothetical protein
VTSGNPPIELCDDRFGLWMVKAPTNITAFSWRLGDELMVYDPFVGNRAWPGGPPPGAIAAMQAQAAAQAAAAQAARMAEINRAKETMRASGATCEIECPLSDGTRGRCEVAAVSRCASCRRTFCEAHQSIDQSTGVGGRAVHYPASLTQCRECQDQEFSSRVASARAEYEQAEAVRQAQREHEERQQREHAAEVALWEAESGWAQAAPRVEWLSQRIAAWEPRRPATAGEAAVAGVVGFAVTVLVGITCGGSVAKNGPLAVLGLLGLMLLMWPTGWSVWILVKRTRQGMRASYARERDLLLETRGCGDPFCVRCDRVPCRDATRRLPWG